MPCPETGDCEWADVNLARVLDFVTVLERWSRYAWDSCQL